MASETTAVPAAGAATETPALSEVESQRRDALVGRLFQATIDGLELLTVYLGERLGFYRALATHGVATAAELAARVGTDERYTREWLEQQAVAGILDVDDPGTDERARRYRLPPSHAEVLLDGDSLNYLAPLAKILPIVATQVPTVAEAFRTGAGIPYSAYGAEAREAQEQLNRPSYLQLLTTEWLPSVQDIQARLLSDSPARVADIGCGAGWASIAIARAYPNVRVDGFDSDDPSVAAARANAEAAGVADRVTFHVRDVADASLAGRYDLMLAFEMIHDLGRPVEALRAMRRLAADGGAVLVMDERTSETFTAPGDETERFFYGASIFWCLPQGLADGPAGTGTVMRPATLSRYAHEAGFRDVQILPIEHPFFRFYRLIP